MGNGRAPCCDKDKVNKGSWSPQEDLKLITYIQRYGHENWRALPKHAGLLRCGKSCRLRWKNYLRPDLKRGNFTKEEEETIIKLHSNWGSQWAKIAAQLPGRTDNEIKNVWNTHLKKTVPAPPKNAHDQLILDKINQLIKDSSVSTSNSTSSTISSTNGTAASNPIILNELLPVEISSDDSSISNVSNDYSSPLASVVNKPNDQMVTMTNSSPLDLDFDDFGGIYTQGVVNYENLIVTNSSPTSFDLVFEELRGICESVDKQNINKPNDEDQMAITNEKINVTNSNPMDLVFDHEQSVTNTENVELVIPYDSDLNNSDFNSDFWSFTEFDNYSTPIEHNNFNIDQPISDFNMQLGFLEDHDQPVRNSNDLQNDDRAASVPRNHEQVFEPGFDDLSFDSFFGLL